MGVYIGSTAGYMRLDSWVMAKIIQLGVWDFCQKFFDFRNDPKGRQFDQTTQAARTVPANIAEGSARHQTSIETELKLLDVARASISETIDDLMFVLLTHKQRAWKSDDPSNLQIRAIRLDAPNYGKDFLYDVTGHILEQKAKFDPWLESEDMIIRVNALIVMCSRTLRMLRSQMEHRLSEFKEKGGFTENMTQPRLDAVKAQNQVEGAPICKQCGAVMVRRTAKKGVNAGHQFWSCSNYHSTGCQYTIPID